MCGSEKEESSRYFKCPTLRISDPGTVCLQIMKGSFSGLMVVSAETSCDFALKEAQKMLKEQAFNTWAAADKLHHGSRQTFNSNKISLAVTAETVN